MQYSARNLMKKTAVGLTAAAVLLTAAPVMARQDKDESAARGMVKLESRGHAGLGLGIFKHKDRSAKHQELNENVFVVAGTIKSVGSNSITISVQRGKLGNDDLAGTDLAVRIDSETKMHMRGNQIEMDDLQAGLSVLVKGVKETNAYEADLIHVQMKNKMVFGEITEVSDDSITIENNKTGEEFTFELDDEAKVYINGQEEDADEIEEGDKGMVKLKVFMNELVVKFVRLFR